MATEFQCTQDTLAGVREDFPPSPRFNHPTDIFYGVPVTTSEAVPEGKLQLWNNGVMVKEFDV